MRNLIKNTLIAMILLSTTAVYAKTNYKCSISTEDNAGNDIVKFHANIEVGDFHDVPEKNIKLNRASIKIEIFNFNGDLEFSETGDVDASKALKNSSFGGDRISGIFYNGVNPYHLVGDLYDDKEVYSGWINCINL